MRCTVVLMVPHIFVLHWQAPPTRDSQRLLHRTPQDPPCKALPHTETAKNPPNTPFHKQASSFPRLSPDSYLYPVCNTLRYLQQHRIHQHPLPLPLSNPHHSPCRPPPSVATTCIWYSGVVSLSKQQTAVRTRPVSGCSENMGSPVRSCITFFWIK